MAELVKIQPADCLKFTIVFTTDDPFAAGFPDVATLNSDDAITTEFMKDAILSGFGFGAQPSDTEDTQRGWGNKTTTVTAENLGGEIEYEYADNNSNMTSQKAFKDIVEASHNLKRPFYVVFGFDGKLDENNQPLKEEFTAGDLVNVAKVTVGKFNIDTTNAQSPRIKAELKNAGNFLYQVPVIANTGGAGADVVVTKMSTIAVNAVDTSLKVVVDGRDDARYCYRWSSSNPSIIECDTRGNIKGVKAGTAKIVGRIPGLSVAGSTVEFSVTCQ